MHNNCLKYSPPTFHRRLLPGSSQACTWRIILSQHRPSICRDFNLVVAPAAIKGGLFRWLCFRLFSFCSKEERRRRRHMFSARRDIETSFMILLEIGLRFYLPWRVMTYYKCPPVSTSVEHKFSRGASSPRMYKFCACFIHSFQIHEVNKRHPSVYNTKIAPFKTYSVHDT